MSTHDEAVDETRERLAPDDVVGNALCDALLASPDPSLIRVVNYHGDWAEAIPDSHDFRRAIAACHAEIALRWPAQDSHGDDIVVRATADAGVFERAAVGSSGSEHVTGGVIGRLCEARGAPELVPHGQVASHFGGDQDD